MMEQMLSTLWTQLTSAGLRLIYAAVILFVGLKLTGLLCRWLKKNERFSHLDDSLRSFLNSLISITLRVLVFVSAALTLGIPATSFVTVLASAGVAAGLALQGALSNLAGGIMLLFFKPFKVGDFIETVDGTGTVKSITVFYTVITTMDNRQLTLPNGSLTNAAITNCTAETTRRADFTFCVAYSSDLDLVKNVLYETAKACEPVISEPEPVVWMSRQGDNALEYTLRVWCLSENYFLLLTSVNEQVKKAFDRAGISIPFPQLDLHIQTEPQNSL